MLRFNLSHSGWVDLKVDDLYTVQRHAANGDNEWIKAGSCNIYDRVFYYFCWQVILNIEESVLPQVPEVKVAPKDSTIYDDFLEDLV